MVLHNCPARFRSAAMGRRFGKTLACSNEIIKAAIDRPGSMNWWVAPVFRQTEIAYSMVEKALVPTGLIAKHQKSLDRFILVNGSVIEFHSVGNEPDRLRGPGIDFLVMDECAMLLKKVWEEILRPTVADRMGRVIFISTPKGRNWFFDMFQAGQAGLRGEELYKDYASFNFPTAMNPFIPEDEIEDARRKLPADVFRQEWLAEFLEESAGVFRGIKACICRVWDEAAPFFSPNHNLPYVNGHTYVIGWDPAKHTNFSVLTVMDKAAREVVAFERFNKIDWSFQLGRMKALAASYRANVIMDATGVGDPLVSQARTMLNPLGLGVTPITFSNTSKNEYIEALAIAVEQTRIHYPDIPELIAELELFQYEYTKSRHVVYSAPEGFNDDCVLSLSLAYSGCSKSGFFEDLVVPSVGALSAMKEEPLSLGGGIQIDALALLYNPELANAINATGKPDPQAGWVWDPLSHTIKYPDGRSRMLLL